MTEYSGAVANMHDESEGITISEIIDEYNHTHVHGLVSLSRLVEELVKTGGGSCHIGRNRPEAIISVLQLDICKQYGKQVLLVSAKREDGLYLFVVGSLPSSMSS